MPEKCFACGKPLKHATYRADTRDAQVVFVGMECFKHVVDAGEAGYQPPQGGPRLYGLRCEHGIRWPHPCRECEDAPVTPSNVLDAPK